MLSSVHGSRKIGFRSTVAKNYSWWPHFRFYTKVATAACAAARTGQLPRAIPYTRAKLTYIPRSVLPNSKTLWENACVMLSRADNSGVRGRVFSLELTPLAPLDF